MEKMSTQCLFLGGCGHNIYQTLVQGLLLEKFRDIRFQLLRPVWQSRVLEEDVLPLARSRDLLLLGFRPWWSPLAASLAGWGGQVMSPISVLQKA